jgi:hypothetical protein
MTAAGTNGFKMWGKQTFITTLNKEEKEKLSTVIEKLKTETDPEKRSALKAEIETIKKDFTSKRQKAQKSLFGRS